MSLLVRLVIMATIVSIVCSAVPRQKHQETLQKTRDIPKVPNKSTILTASKRTVIAKQNGQTNNKDSTLTKKERTNSKDSTLTQHKKAAIPRYPQQKKNKAKLAARRKRSAQSNARSVVKKKKTTVQEFPLNDLIYKGRASNEANKFIRANSKTGKPLELVYEYTREQDLNEIEERIQRRFIEYSSLKT